MSPNATLEIALVGAGLVGQLHARAIASVPGMRIVALADLRPELCARVAHAACIPRTYRTHQELLDAEKVDAVAVVVHRSATSMVVRDCLLANKHVYSEKPMAMTERVARELTELASERNLHYAIGFQKRHDPATDRCRELLSEFERNGDLGRLMFVRGWNHTGRDRDTVSDSIMTDEARPTALKRDPVAPPWLPAIYQHSYDRFINTYCHDINALHYFFDKTPVVRAAELSHLGGQAVILGYSDFIVNMALTLSELAPWSQRGEWDEGFDFHYEAGRLQLVFPPPLYSNRIARLVLRRGADAPEIVIDGHSPVSVFTLQARNFLSSLRGGETFCASAQNSLPDMILMDQIWRKGIENSAAHDTGTYELIR